MIFNFSKQEVTCAQLNKLQEDPLSPVKYPCPLPVGIYSKRLDLTLPKIDLGAVGKTLGGVSFSLNIFLLEREPCF